MKRQKELTIILVPALILTVLWVIFTVLHSYQTSTIKDPLTNLIIPIEGTFDQETIEEIRNRKRIEASTQITIQNPEEDPDQILIEDENASLSAEINPEEEE